VLGRNALVGLVRHTNPQEAARDIDHYIVGFYNASRLHSTLNYQSPGAFENNLSNT